MESAEISFVIVLLKEGVIMINRCAWGKSPGKFRMVDIRKATGVGVMEVLNAVLKVRF